MNHLETSSAEHLSVFAAVASEVVVCVCRDEKALPCNKRRILVIFLYLCGFSLTSYMVDGKERRKKKKNNMDTFVG